MTFLKGNTLLGLSILNNSGTAAYSVQSMKEGTHEIRAIYGGDNRYAGAMTAINQEVVQGLKNKSATLNDQTAETTGILQVFPNPARDILFLRFENYQGEVTLRLINAQGQTLRYFEQEVPALIELDVKGLPDGIYTITAIGNNGLIDTKKVVILY